MIFLLPNFNILFQSKESLNTLNKIICCFHINSYCNIVTTNSHNKINLSVVQNEYGNTPYIGGGLAGVSFKKKKEKKAKKTNSIQNTK